MLQGRSGSYVKFKVVARREERQMSFREQNQILESAILQAFA